VREEKDGGLVGVFRKDRVVWFGGWVWRGWVGLERSEINDGVDENYVEDYEQEERRWWKIKKKLGAGSSLLNTMDMQSNS